MAMYLPLKRGTFTISSGYRTKSRPDHRGIDFSAPTGTPIYAPFDARVIQGKDRAPGSVEGFGNWVWLEGIDEPYDFIVGHMKHSSITVRAGDTVKAGQKIAEVASEGQSTGPHAHCELWSRPGRIGGRDIDPTKFWGDNALNPGAPTTASTGTIFGVDVSEHNDGLSLAKAKAEGISFVIIRLCDGTYRDKVFHSHLEDAETNGLLTSTYWYLRAPSEGTTIAQQVDVIDQQMGGRRDLGVWIDVESVSKNGAKLLTKDDVWAAKRELESRGYHVPGIYSGAWYWENMPGGEPSMDGLGHLWVSNYGKNRTGAPRTLYDQDGGDNHKGWGYPLGDRKPDILQFGSNGMVAGKFPVDVNAYRGTREELARIFNGNTTNQNVTTKEHKVTPEQAERIEKKLDAILYQLAGDNYRGLPQTGNRTLLDLTAAVAERVDVPGTYDKMAVLKAKKEV